MATFNTPHEYLRASIQSILNQTYSNFEFIIIDDGSSNNDSKVIKEFKDNRILFFQNSVNIGLASTLNLGIKLSNGKYIARMDSDDIALKNRLMKQITYLEKNPTIDILGSSALYFGSYEKRVNFKRNDNLIKPFLFLGNPICHPTVVFRKKIIENNNLLYPVNQRSEDYAMWIKCFELGLKFHNLNEISLKYRVHSKQVTQNNNLEIKYSTNNLRIYLLKKYTNITSNSDFNLYNTFMNGEKKTLYDFFNFFKIIFFIKINNRNTFIISNFLFKSFLFRKFIREFGRFIINF
jgi:glycosyltransferase involved in cell wall biosynthesis